MIAPVQTREVQHDLLAPVPRCVVEEQRPACLQGCGVALACGPIVDFYHSRRGRWTVP